MKYIRQIAKTLLWVVTSALLLLMILLFTIQSGMLNSFIASTISTQSTKAINGKLKIEAIEGSLLSHFSLRNISINQGDSSLITISSIHLDYKLMQLLKKEVKINKFEIQDMQVNATQMSDSTWNLQQLIIPKDKKDTSSSSNKWHITVNQFLSDSLKARLIPLNPQKIPKQIKLKMQLAVKMGPDNLSLDMQDIYLNTKSPYLKLNKMHGIIRKTNNRLVWDNLRLSFDKTNLHSQGSLNLDSLVKSEGTLVISPLQLNEFQSWFPTVKLNGSPEILLKMDALENQSNLNLSMAEAQQKLLLSGRLNHSTDQPVYSFQLNLDSLDGMHWTGRKELQSSINGSVYIQGNGTNIEENDIQTQGTFENVSYGEYKMNNLRFNINKKQANINGEVKANAWFGDLATRFSLKDLFSRLKYNVEGDFQRINLAKLSGDSKHSSNLNFKFHATGSGTKPDSMQSDIEMNLTPSYLWNKPVASMDVAISYNQGNYSVETFNLNATFASLDIKGEGHYQNNNNVQYRLKIHEIGQVSRQVFQTDLSVNGKIQGSVKGPLDSLATQNDFELANLSYDSLNAKQLKGTISGIYGDSLRSGKINIKIDSISDRNQHIKNLSIDGQYESKEFSSILNVTVHDSLNLLTNSKIQLKNDPVIYLRELKIDAKNQQWTGGSDSTSILLAKDSVRVNKFRLQSGNQKAKIHGTYAFNGKESLNIELDNINLSSLAKFTNFQSPIDGKLNSSIYLKGTAEKPLLDAEIHIDHPQFDSLHFQKIQTNLSYNNDSISFDGKINTTDTLLLQAFAEFPYHLSLKDTIRMPGKTNPLEASLFVNQFNLNWLNSFVTQQGMKLNGQLTLDASVGNTFGKPNYKGRITMNKGEFFFKQMGINYTDIDLQSDFKENKLELNQLKMKSGDGKLNINGNLDLALLKQKEDNNIYLNIKGNQFQAINSDLARATITPDIVLEGTLNKPVIKGNIKILRALINSDVLMDKFSVKTTNPNPPLLVKALEDTVKEDTKIASDTVTKDKQVARPNFYKNLRGTFDLIIPGNTWIRGEDMNFEVQGDLKAIKQREQINLFGNLNINRGYIEYYGKKFDFEKGKLTFTGGQDINPELDLRILYTFRDPDRELHTIALEIAGKSMTPEMTFYMDEQRIEEREALSYIIFGKSTNQLSEHEKTSVEESAKNIAGTLAMNQVSLLIKDALRSSVGLDIVEVSSGKNWSSGSVKIGKYITDNLYLGYQQTFAFNKKEKTIEPEKITLEYQILRSLFLQATNQSNNSGFDLIFKKSWK
jgi:autotransporter translocation and assembly factor TamB